MIPYIFPKHISICLFFLPRYMSLFLSLYVSFRLFILLINILTNLGICFIPESSILPTSALFIKKGFLCRIRPWVISWTATDAKRRPPSSPMSTSASLKGPTSIGSPRPPLRPQSFASIKVVIRVKVLQQIRSWFTVRRWSTFSTCTTTFVDFWKCFISIFVIFQLSQTAQIYKELTNDSFNDFASCLDLNLSESSLV